MEQSVQDFIQGAIVVMLPSMFAVAWLLWRAGTLDREFDQFD
jgi:hypothetical protein